MSPCLDRIAVLASADLQSAEVALRKIPNDDPAGAFSDVVLDRVRRNLATLCEIREENERLGFTVYEICETPGHREFVSVATYCEPGKPLRYDLEKVLESLARRENCQSLRMHTVRHGLVKAALACGWHTAEIVLRKNLP